MTTVKVGTPLWSNGFGVVTRVGGEDVGVVFLAGGIPRIVGHAPRAAVLQWAQSWLDLLAGGLVVDAYAILEESKG